jgi:hypothetical protein
VRSCPRASARAERFRRRDRGTMLVRATIRAKVLLSDPALTS